MIRILLLSLALMGCATGLTGETFLRKYEVPISMTAPETLAENATNYQ